MKLFHRTVRLLPDNSKFKRQNFSLAHAERSAYIFTVRNVVAARLCFHRRLSFCSQGVCVRVCVWQIRPWADTFHRQTPSIGRHPPLADTPLGRHPTGQTPPWADPLGRHPREDRPGQTPPYEMATAAESYCILLECILV